jgi:hypothetical protein
MFHALSYPIIDAFAAGQAAQGEGGSMSDNPFVPGTLDYTQWIIGYQWGSDSRKPPANARHIGRSARS